MLWTCRVAHSLIRAKTTTADNLVSTRQVKIAPFARKGKNTGIKHLSAVAA